MKQVKVKRRYFSNGEEIVMNLFELFIPLDNSEGGQLESIKDYSEQVGRNLARLLASLVEKDVITLKEAMDIAGVYEYVLVEEET